MSHNVELIKKYFNALSNGDFETVGSLMSDELVWHQPGKGILSGTYKGKGTVFAHLGKFAELSKGTFAIDGVEYMTDNNELIVASIHFKATSGADSISMKGVDLFRIKNDKIQEVWLFSEDIESEDRFWTKLSGGNR